MSGRSDYEQQCLRRVEQIEEKSLSKGTKATYQSKINVFKQWLEKNYPSCIDAGAKFGIRCPVEETILKTFAGELLREYESESDEEESENDDDDGTDAQTVRTAVSQKKGSVVGSTFNNYISALTYLYKESGVADASSLTRGVLKKCLTGLKRTDATNRQNGKLPAMEGKAPLTFAGYQIIATYAIREQRQRSSFCWLYVLLCWNLICRSNNVGFILYDHISWEGDALVIQLPKTKGDQEGTSSYPRHLYSNPDNSYVCPVLALAVHVFSSGLCNSNAQLKLFQSTKPQSLFNEWLSQLWKTIAADEDKRKGMTVVDGGVGSHSFR